MCFGVASAKKGEDQVSILGLDLGDGLFLDTDGLFK